MQNYLVLIFSCCQIVLQVRSSTLLSKEQANNEEHLGL